MEENSFILKNKGVIGLVLVLAGSYFFGFPGLCVSFLISIVIIKLIDEDVF